MAGWDLNHGVITKKVKSNEEFWGIINNIFSSKSKNTSTYKFCFLKAILDNLFVCDNEYVLEFEQIFKTMSEIYWNLIFHHELKQNTPSIKQEKSKIESIIIQLVDEYNVLPYTTYELLDDKIKEIFTKKATSALSQYVVGALYEDAQGALYAFSKKEKKVILSASAYNYLVKYKFIIEKLNYYEWLRFLEKINPQEKAFAIGKKLDESTRRMNLIKYREFLLYDYKQTNCFYCHKDLLINSVNVDHFVPWSFFKRDQLWNFVLACKKCNQSKTDKMPSEYFLENIKNRNEKIIDSLCKNYLVVNDFANYSGKRIEIVYNSAIVNGFNRMWK